MIQTLETRRDGDGGGGGSVKVGTTGTISALMSREIDSPSSSRHLPPPPSSTNAVSGDNPDTKTAAADQASSSSSKSSRTRHSSRTTTRKPSSVVEIVDIKCGHPDKTWVNPIANKLKKLTFSKFSEAAAI
ncbi:hypothetical protein M569_09318 [Genlisea aurea]|uniref:Uncharacterized protein n=1 Tax=Genlisea aurea TaxID=192259 RepID=S8CL58_9LAMI|nr:hypothetical protein M569_09318 [Genlisea aurea]